MRHSWLFLLILFWPAIGQAVDPAADPASAPKFALPVDCSIGDVCFIQQYVDRDPSGGVRDFACGNDTYDGHKGTDFGILSLFDKVAVLAAADGVVIARRDGMKDGHPDKIGYKRGGKDCGNRIGIKHANGWITDHCHLRRGSLLVKTGDKVKQGQPIALVGQSGNADFPHLHFSVQHGKTYYDPFDGGKITQSCKIDENSMWQEAALSDMPPMGPVVMQAGFALKLVKRLDLQNGYRGTTNFPTKVPALVLFTRAVNLNKGDRLRLSITQPDGKVFIENASKPMQRARAVQFQLAGRKGTGKGLQKGTWTGNVEVVTSDGSVATSKKVTMQVK